MQQAVAATPTALIPQLDFSLPSTAEYVTQRRQATAHTTGASTFSYTGNQVAKINFTSESEWLDLSSVVFQLRLKNSLDTDMLFGDTVRFSGSLVSRVRVFGNNVLLEDVRYHHRVYNMFAALLPEDVLRASTMGDMGGRGVLKIAPGNTYTVAMKPLASGFFSSNKMIPLKHCNITVELTFGVPPGLIVQNGGPPPYEVDLVTARHDLVTLAPQVEAQLGRLIRERGLSITFQQTAVSFHTLADASSPFVPAGSTSDNVSVVSHRMFSRLNAAFVIFGVTDPESAQSPGRMYYPRTELRDAGQDGALSDRHVTQWQWSIGERKWPERAASTIEETYDNMLRAANMYGGLVKPQVRWGDYVTSSFVLGTSFRRVPGQFASGLSTRNGDALRLDLHNVDTTTTRTCWLVLVAEACVEIRDGSVSFSD